MTCRHSASRRSCSTSRPMPSRGSDAHHTEDRAAIVARGATPRAGDLLQEARERERAGELRQAIERYHAAIAAAETGEEWAVLAEALRRLAIVHQQRDESAQAHELCRRSYDVASRM